jgi:hypothetical protein
MRILKIGAVYSWCKFGHGVNPGQRESLILMQSVGPSAMLKTEPPRKEAKKAMLKNMIGKEEAKGSIRDQVQIHA